MCALSILSGIVVRMWCGCGLDVTFDLQGTEAQVCVVVSMFVEEMQRVMEEMVVSMHQENFGRYVERGGEGEGERGRGREREGERERERERERDRDRGRGERE